MAALGLGPEEVKWTHAYKSTFEKNLFSPTDSHGNKRVILIGGDDKEVPISLSFKSFFVMSHIIEIRQ